MTPNGADFSFLFYCVSRCNVGPLQINCLQGQSCSQDNPFFATLGLGPSADAARVRKAYRQLAGKWHPDKWGSCSKQQQDAAAEEFAQIAESYAALTEKY